MRALLGQEDLGIQMNNHNSKIFFLIFFLLMCAPAFAQPLPGALHVWTIPYSKESQLGLGDSLSLFSGRLDRCIEYKDMEAKYTGESSITVRFIGSSSDLEAELKRSFSAQATSHIDVAKLGEFRSSIKYVGSFEDFIKDARNTTFLEIKAHSDSGRDFIEKYSIKEEYKNAFKEYKNSFENIKIHPKEEYQSNFTDNCGTHFIRGITRASSIRVLFRFKGLDKFYKKLFDNAINVSGGASVGIISKIKGGASVNITTKVSSLLKMAAKLSDVKVDVETIGGGGLETLVPIVAGLNYKAPEESVKEILKNLAKAASDFNNDNAGRISFIVAPYFSTPKQIASKPERFDVLEEIYKALIRVDQVLRKYTEYEDRNHDIWAKYFRVKAEKLKSLRDKLRVSFQKCSQEGACKFNSSTEIEGVFLDDVITVEAIDANCSYGIPGKSVGLPNEGNLISSVTVRVKGKMMFKDKVDLHGITFYALTPDLEEKQLPVIFDKHFQIHEDEDTVYIDMYTPDFPKDIYVTNGKLNEARLIAERKKVTRSIYLARIPFIGSGEDIEVVFGYPHIKGCSPRQE